VPENGVCLLCGTSHEVTESLIAYDYDTLLWRHYRSEFLRNKVLNNNALLSYLWMPDGSLSSDERVDVGRFRSFSRRQLPGGVIMDVGCGPLARPGYLDFDSGRHEYIGLDPLETNFDGMRVRGVAEFIPFPNESLDGMVFATSLDHVCSPLGAFREARRVLKAGGTVVVWMSDLQPAFTDRLMDAARTLRKSVKDRYRADRYWVYDGGRVVLYRPWWAVDPYHSWRERPGRVIRHARVAGFECVAQERHGANEVFLAFR
jgi:SAM-dependent methyltransferase